MTATEIPAPTVPKAPYVLGSSAPEQSRLDLQAAYYRMATVDALRWAGVSPGMRVLDLGSGTGAVALEVARLVGPAGSVLGLDSSPDAAAAATRNAAELGLAHVRFEVTDLDTWTPDPTAEPFDALTARLVCMYLPDAAATLARLSTMLRPGGVVLVEEFAISSAVQRPETREMRVAMDRLLAAFRLAGVPTDLGWELGRLFRDAGLGQPTMTVGGRWEDDADAAGYALLARVTATLAPVMIGHGLATAEEVDPVTVEAGLRAAGIRVGAGFHPPLLVSAWARTPEG